MSPHAKLALPPLNAVRTFETAARCGSFALAAAELHVTHWAIGKQIRLLEDWLGAPLFERRARGVVLTDDGMDFMADVSVALARLEVAARRLRRSNNERRVSGVVRINVLPSFALRWLIQRLPQFQEAYPHIDVEISTTSRRLRTVGGAFDMAVRLGVERIAGVIHEPLMSDQRLPACSPNVLKMYPVETVEDLQRHTLLHSTTTKSAWAEWFSAAKAPSLSPVRHLQFDHVYLQLQAAVDGLGIALASMPLIETDIAAGRLVCPLPGPVWHGEDYVLLVRADRARNVAVKALREWILAKAKASRS